MPAQPPASTSPNPELSDTDEGLLMHRIAGGDEASLRELIERWKTPLLNFFYRSTNNYATAEDLTQIVFVRLYRAAPRYTARAKFSTYLFHIARRLLINEYQKNRRKPADAVDPAEMHAIDDDSSARTVAELEEIFAHAVGRLPENQRTAILLLKQQQLSYTEIAAVMNATESAVKTWIFRARQTLQQALRSEVL